jgi:hypothetical protein
MSRRRIRDGELSRLERQAGYDAAPEHVVREQVADRLAEIAANLKALPLSASLDSEVTVPAHRIGLAAPVMDLPLHEVHEQGRGDPSSSMTAPAANELR